MSGFVVKSKIRRVALRVTTNIDLLIKDFFHNPPSYKAVITLSWKASEPAAAEVAAATNKRTLSASRADESGSSKKKTERGVYAPPSGRYSVNNSSSFSTYNNQQGQGKRRTYSNGANRY